MSVASPIEAFALELFLKALDELRLHHGLILVVSPVESTLESTPFVGKS